MIKVGFRVDGSKNIGMGHVMRCLSLADGFKASGVEGVFLSRYKTGISKIREHGFEVIELSNCLESNCEDFYYGDSKTLDKEAEEIIANLRVQSINVLFVDSYNVTEEFFLMINPFVERLCYIDDVNEFTYPVDVLINGNITGELLNYERYYDDEIMLLGLKYNLIRNEFKKLPRREINRNVKEIMITTGGSDPFDLSYRLTELILSDGISEDIRINIVAGSGFTNVNRLRKLSRENNCVVMYENVSKMSEIMLKSDVAISAGGSTLYELCACGTPTIAFIIAKNQKRIVNMLSDKGYIESLGWYNEFSDKEFLDRLKGLCMDFEKRESYSQKMQKLLDGKGVSRVVDAIFKSCK